MVFKIFLCFLNNCDNKLTARQSFDGGDLISHPSWTISWDVLSSSMPTTFGSAVYITLSRQTSCIVCRPVASEYQVDETTHTTP